ncbi:alpha/beta hydrolase [Rossellomorea vietnamensis]|uniref:alpha/beta hydrolase n=1 Tax=Rossellomorea vietnamensis TaxID=218284 RepID=UPI003D2C22CB
MRAIHSVIIGKGKPLIFLPAAGFSGIEGLNIAQSLAERYECHLLDLPGMGKSEGIKGEVTKEKIASWLKVYIDQHKMDKATLIGHSMGGGFAMCFASEYPELVNKMVLLDQGHIGIPRLPTKDFGSLGYLMPAISIIEKIYGDRFIRKIEKFFITENEHKVTDAEFNNQLKTFCERFKVEESDYIKKALMEDVNFTGEGIRVMFGYYRLNLPKILMKLTVPCLLIYASFKDIDNKRMQRTTKAIHKIDHLKNLSVCKIDSHHYVHWSGNRCIEEIKGYLDLNIFPLNYSTNEGLTE